MHTNTLKLERRRLHVNSTSTLKVISSLTYLKIRYHVPAHIQEHVDYITPGIKLFAPKRSSNPTSDLEKRASYKLPALLNSVGLSLEALLAIPELAVCDVAITPACIKTLYNVTAGTKAAAGNQLGIFEDLGDVYSQTDLNLFFASFAQ